MTRSLRRVQPSLRDLGRMTRTPSVETLGYCQPSLRDEDGQSLLALEYPGFSMRRSALNAET
jgi:hypothetical protein